MQTKSNRFLATLGLLLLLAGNAEAHALAPSASSLYSGFVHPFLGLDHLLAMIAVGLWAARLGRQARWTLPPVFAAVMVTGFGLARFGWSVPLVEPLLAASVLLLGLLAVGPQRVSMILSVLLVSLFGLLHGYAHGIELPIAGNVWLYPAGFALASVVLQATGVALFLLLSRVRGAVTLGGAAIAATGMVLLANI